MLDRILADDHALGAYFPVYRIEIGKRENGARRILEQIDADDRILLVDDRISVPVLRRAQQDGFPLMFGYAPHRIPPRLALFYIVEFR